MKPVDWVSHPIQVIKSLRQRLGDDVVLSFSRYFYRKQSLDDFRQVFWVPIVDVEDTWLTSILADLGEGEELALNSTIKVDGVSYQVPMIDFDGMSENHFDAALQVFGNSFLERLIFFRSGRSFHAYGIDILSDADWIKFMGRLLLCNLPGKRKVVDQRWIGHRLIGGYSSLRWSCNTDRHKQYPSLVASMAAVSKMSVRKKKKLTFDAL